MQIVKFPIKKYGDGSFKEENDTIIVEKSLDIFINGKKKFSITRLPGNDVELSVGLCFHKCLIDSFEDIAMIAEDEPNSGRIDIEIPGKINRGDGDKTITETCTLPPKTLFSLVDDFTNRQKSFEGTGGTHAIAIYNKKRENVTFAEDVGRHNAFDKCIGHLVMESKNEEAAIAILSSRINGELVSKASRIGVEIIAGVSAPTSLAVELATKRNITLIGFLRKRRFSIYSVPERIIE